MRSLALYSTKKYNVQVITAVVISKGAEKDLRKVPKHVQVNSTLWPSRDWSMYAKCLAITTSRLQARERDSDQSGSAKGMARSTKSKAARRNLCAYSK